VEEITSPFTPLQVVNHMLTGGPNPSYNVSRSIQQRYSYLVSHASHNYQHTDNGLMIAKKEIIINNETIWKRKRQRNYPSWYHMYWKVNVNTREFKRRSTYRHTMQASKDARTWTSVCFPYTNVVGFFKQSIWMCFLQRIKDFHSK